MNKKWIVGLITGVVIAAGAGVWAVGSGSIAIDKVENFNVTLPEMVEGTVADLGQMLGGLSNLDLSEINWLNTGSIASTTDGTWASEVQLKVTGDSGVSDDYWRNDTFGDVWVTAQLYGRGIATGTMQVYVATSSASSLTNYTYTTSGKSTAFGQTNNLVHAFVGTSTPSFSVSGTSTPPMMIKKGGYVVLEKIRKNATCVGGGTSLFANSGHCPSATSTAFGMDFIAIITIHATTTPNETN